MEGILFRPPMAVLRSSPIGKNTAERSETPIKSRHPYMIFQPFTRIWPVGVTKEEDRKNETLQAVSEEEERENWVMKILRVRSILPAEDRKPREPITVDLIEDSDRCVACNDDRDHDHDTCAVSYEDGEEEVMKFDRESFSKLLQRVPLKETRLFLKLSDIGSIAYVISKLNPADLLKDRGMTLIASSADERPSEAVPAAERAKAERREQRKTSPMRAASAYQIAASAASYLQSQTWSIISRGRTDDREDEGSAVRPELNSFMATTDSVTAVVAAKEEMKQAVAEDLNSAKSSPCEWFICDEDSSRTRYFVIQGSESLASWQANLLFEPVPFEGLDILVHRGIYEAAKGIYQRMLPHVREHYKLHGDGAAFRFTGHSLGGSLSLLVSLMLLLRGEIPASTLLPIVMFGAPSVMCGGDRLLRQLGLPKSHVQGITMHRDIVPRAFSCNYPDHVAEILKAVNSNFRSHPCLKHQKLLYTPMGELLILQPEERFSPEHELLPAGTGLYLLAAEAEKVARAAKSVFFNSPHPLEILSDRAAYGSEGTVYRDHDVNAYLRSVKGVVEHEVRQAHRAQLRRPVTGSGLLRLADFGPSPFVFVFLLPARLLFAGALSIFAMG